MNLPVNRVYANDQYKPDIACILHIDKYLLLNQSPRFKSFGSSLNSLNPTLRPNLRPNSDDSLCHVIDSCEILDST